jgi:hypothetical protein
LLQTLFTTKDFNSHSIKPDKEWLLDEFSTKTTTEGLNFHYSVILIKVGNSFSLNCYFDQTRD